MYGYLRVQGGTPAHEGRPDLRLFSSPRVREELEAVEHERLEVDLNELSLSTIVYDTAEPDLG